MIRVFMWNIVCADPNFSELCSSRSGKAATGAAVVGVAVVFLNVEINRSYIKIQCIAEWI